MGRLRPLGYSPSGLTQAQKNYSAGELECWALIAAARKWRYYLQAACKVVFLSDHNPLRWLRGQKDPRHKFSRWIQELEAIDYEIHYVRGKENAAADYLSRLSREVDLNVNNDFDHFERHLFPISDCRHLISRIREGSRVDKAISLMLDQLENGGVIHTGRFKRQHGMHVSEGLLYRGDQVVIPHRPRNEILTLIHNDSHPGIRKTIAKTKLHFYWRGLYRDVERFCDGCLICQKNKPKNQPREPLKQITIAAEPRHAMSYDIATLPWSTDNHRYFLLMTDFFSKFVELYPMTDRLLSLCVGVCSKGGYTDMAHPRSC